MNEPLPSLTAQLLLDVRYLKDKVDAQNLDIPKPDLFKIRMQFCPAQVLKSKLSRNLPELTQARSTHATSRFFYLKRSRLASEFWTIETVNIRKLDAT